MYTWEHIIKVDVLEVQYVVLAEAVTDIRSSEKVGNFLSI